MNPEDNSPSAWFGVFREQSFDAESLGKLIWSKEMGGGLSGARVAVGLFPHGEPGVDDQQPIVFKWGPLHDICTEADSRRDHAFQAGGKHLATLQTLRRRGASHVAIRVSPGGTSELFGIVASLYEGTFDMGQASRISDFQVFIQNVYVRDGAVSDDDLLWYFQQAAAAVAPVGAHTQGNLSLIELPDLREMNTRYTDAIRELRSHGSDPQAVEGISEWLNAKLGEQVKYLDSRVVHGDPRFANVMLNRVVNEVSLIDFGAGGPNRHVFHDLARFEVDVLFRSTEPKGNREKDILARVGFLLGEKKVTKRTPREQRVAAQWRRARNRHLTVLVLPEIMDLYSMFILNELFRRAGWYKKAGRTSADVGASPSEIVTAIGAVVSHMEETQRRNGR